MPFYGLWNQTRLSIFMTAESHITSPPIRIQDTGCGGLIGIVLSVILLQLGKSFLLTKDTVVTFEMLFKPVLFAAALFFTLLLNLLSAGLPAIRISREQIVEALNNK